MTKVKKTLLEKEMKQFTCCDTIQDENMCELCQVENICRECVGYMGEYGWWKEPVCPACLPTCNKCGEQLEKRKDKCCGEGRTDDNSDDESDDESDRTDDESDDESDKWDYEELKQKYNNLIDVIQELRRPK